MNVRAIVLLICLGFAAPVAAEGSRGGKAVSPAAAPKAALSEIRKLVHELERDAGKLGDLMAQYRSLVEKRPRGKKAGEQLAKWNKAVDRLLRRIDKARTAMVETMQSLDQAATGKLPTGLGKELANARNEAKAARSASKQALAKRRPARASKRPKKAPEAEDNSHLLDDL